ncbi:polyprenyl synthetase family protein [uncultured Serinicoccus sp.]|uniref:polyprenyl synthetase family protein n=1 Tax=uncultured Serinicoccus sp. TaxID=735514 RepID=UPI0026244CB0|nr:polyprenyl synthetase family protein [uncultured Serinicoccus sp.]
MACDGAGSHTRQYEEADRYNGQGSSPAELSGLRSGRGPLKDVHARLLTRYEECLGLWGLGRTLAEELPRSGRLNRGILVVRSADMSEASYRLAVAVESLHRASVIRDDIQDDDKVRRQLPALHARIGVARALAVADVMLSRSLRTFDEFADPRAMRLAVRCYERMARGQALDVGGVLLARGTSLSDAAREKTGSLVALAFGVGAVCAGLDDQAVNARMGIGEDLGTYFQLCNDVRNVTVDEGRGNFGSDLRLGRHSSVAVALRKSQVDVRSVEETALRQAVVDVQMEANLMLERALSRASTIDLPRDLLEVLSGDLHHIVSDQEAPL